MVNITKQRLQLKSKNLPELKKIAKELYIHASTLKKDQIVDKIIFKRNTIALDAGKNKLLLQTKNITELKKIAKELGVCDIVTKFSKHNKDQLVGEIIFKQNTTAAEEEEEEEVSTATKVITISISCSCKNAVVRVVEEKPEPQLADLRKMAYDAKN